MDWNALRPRPQIALNAGRQKELSGTDQEEVDAAAAVTF
jgi:hypothetical protein